MCEIGDLDPCSIWKETERTARKRHPCSTCRGAILPGEKYVVHFSVFEGDATSEKICLPCREARKQFCDEHLDGQLMAPSTFADFLSECIGEDGPSTKWAPMQAAMRARREAVPNAG